MTDEILEIPLTQSQREVLNLGFTTLVEALTEDNNPFPEAVVACLTDSQLEDLYKLIKKSQEQTNTSSLFLHLSECFAFYVIVDLTRHVFASNYFVNFMKNGGIDVDLRRNHVMDVKNTIHTFSISVLESLKEWTTIESFAEYIVDAQSFPDLVTGISPKLAAYNHIPKIPDNPPQLNFSDYDEAGSFIYTVRDNPLGLLKDLNCLGSILFILGDKENPPAKIITAYFPNLEREIMDMMPKIMISDKRRKKVKLTDGDIGVLYACSDLFGRLRASSYHKLINQLEKGTSFENVGTTIEDVFVRGDNKSFMMTTIEMSLKYDNENFGDYDVIKDYRAIAAQMIGFDD